MQQQDMIDKKNDIDIFFFERIPINGTPPTSSIKLGFSYYGGRICEDNESLTANMRLIHDEGHGSVFKLVTYDYSSSIFRC